ncbi:MAG: magnesium transporter [Lentimonas sp.]|jgi:magnesium transporter
MKKPKTDYLDTITKLLKEPIHLLTTKDFDFTKKQSIPGAAPGIEDRKDIKEPPKTGEIPIRCIHYSESKLIENNYDHIDDFIESNPSNSSHYQWINIDGLNPYVINRLKEHYQLHTLAAEDTLNVPQRPKFETYEGQLFMVMRMLMLKEGRIINEQVSIFHLENALITIQEAPGDIWDKVRKRMNKPKSRFLKLGKDYLLYALTDAIIDHIFPILEDYGDLLDELESQVLKDPKSELQQHIHQIRRELSLYRRIVAPTRELLYALYQDKGEIFDDSVTPFFRDVHDHTHQLLDTIDSYREMASGLNELYHTTVTEKLNGTMKVLTIMASFFIPLTFLAGVYGMNFKHMPELGWLYGYPTFWIICAITTIGMWWYFRCKGWLGNRRR